uniref:Uncharacterized protein n=1 Tax=Davidia involucrata TaxID=16924 RepID=A0A5B7BX48_DAVIN
MGGGAMVTPVAGAVGAGIRGGPPDPLTITTKTTTNLRSHHISSSSSHLNLPVSANCTAPLRPTTTNCSCLGETSTTPLESVDGREDKRASGLFNYDFVFGPVPSPIEVEKAISDLQSFMLGFCPSGSELEQMLYLYDPRMLQSLGYSRVYDAFRLLHTDPSVQRMVTSISSDKAVWDAVMNNKAVQELRESLCTAKEERPEAQSSNEDSDSDMATLILNWILGIIKAKVMELIEKFGSLVNEIFQPPEKGKLVSFQLEEKLRSSFLLSIVILLLVVVTRDQGA